jgi:hypothetical protein
MKSMAAGVTSQGIELSTPQAEANDLQYSHSSDPPDPQWDAGSS